MLIHFHLTVRTVAESATFILDAELPAVPAVGDELDLHFDFGPYIVREVTDQAGAITCVVDNWDDLGEPALSMELIAGDLADMARAGWRKCEA